MAGRYRKKPLTQFEHGTRIYAPSDGERTYRVVARDPSTGQRIFAKRATEDEARERAREIEALVASAVPVRSHEDGARTVGALADRYVEDHLTSLSLRYREKQEYLLQRWILPRLADLPIAQWTSADSIAVLASVRRDGRSPALVQDVGVAMRSLVTHARRLRWLTSHSEDPMWMVSYSMRATVQGAHAQFVARSSLPTDDQCRDLFVAMERRGEPTWALAMRLKHRSGLRWGELTALQAGDVDLDSRIVHVRRAVEQGRSGPPALKLPKNGQIRTAIFPRSLAEDLHARVDEVTESAGAEGLLFPSRRGELMRRSSFQQVWIKAASDAGWPMRTPLRRSAGYGDGGRGWRWTGSAQWTPHALRHVAACWMLFDLGLDAAVVAEKLGHSDPSFTLKRYVGTRADTNAIAMAATETW